MRSNITPRAAPTRLETERLMLRPFQIEEQQVLCSFWRRNQDRLRDSLRATRNVPHVRILAPGLGLRPVTGRCPGGYSSGAHSGAAAQHFQER